MRGRATSRPRRSPAPRCRRSWASSMPRPRPSSNAPGRSSSRSWKQKSKPPGGTTMRNLALCYIVLLMLGAAPAWSLSDKPYLAETDADFANLLPPPPAGGSAGDKRGMQMLLDLQKTLTPQRPGRRPGDTAPTGYPGSGEVLGPTLTQE